MKEPIRDPKEVLGNVAQGMGCGCVLIVLFFLFKGFYFLTLLFQFVGIFKK